MQVDGNPMGLPFGPVFAYILMIELEKAILPELTECYLQNTCKTQNSCKDCRYCWYDFLC